jgi:predicted TIM-barrel fold metal-dependent hydrolase
MKEGFRFVDVDMHIKEPYDLFDKYLDPAYRHRVSSGVNLTRFNAYHWLIDGRPLKTDGDLLQFHRGGDGFNKKNPNVAFAAERGYDAESTLIAMEAEGVDIAVLFPTVGLYFTARPDLDPRLSLALCRAYNDWLHEYCAKSPHQLKMAAMLPVQDVNLACQELVRCVRDYGAVGAFLRPGCMNERYWHSIYWGALYHQLEEMGIPLCFHDGTSAHSSQIEPRFGANRFLRHVASHPVEMQLALISLLLGGIYEFHPKLKTVFLEAQSWWVPGLLERMELDLPYHRADAPYLKLTPLEYWKRNCFSTIQSGEHTLGGIIDYLGDAATLAVSTDFPHFDSLYPEASSRVLSNPSITRPIGGQILSGGARVYGFSEEDFRKADAAATARRGKTGR